MSDQVEGAEPGEEADGRSKSGDLGIALRHLVDASRAILQEGTVEAFDGVAEALQMIDGLEGRSTPGSYRYHYHASIQVRVGKSATLRSVLIGTDKPIVSAEQIISIQADLAQQYHPRDRESGAVLVASAAVVDLVAYELLRVEFIPQDAMARPIVPLAGLPQEEAPALRLVEP